MDPSDSIIDCTSTKCVITNGVLTFKTGTDGSSNAVISNSTDSLSPRVFFFPKKYKSFK
jgi:hypothetical protein